MQTFAAPALDPDAPLLRALRAWDGDAQAIFGLGPRPGRSSGGLPLGALIDRAAEVQARALPRAELAAALVRQAEARGAKAASVAAARRLAQPEVVAVVTGQQVGIFGGPALTLFKALGAVATARALEAAGIAATPVFWMASFDHDRAEVAQADAVTGAHDRQALRLRGPGAGRPVGALRLGAAIERLGAELFAAIDGGGPSPRCAAAFALVAEHYRGAATFAAAFAGLLGALTDDLGLVLLDPADPAFAGLAPARALVARELAAPGSWSRARLAESAAALRERGFSPLIPGRRGGRLGVFFTDDDGRRAPLFAAADGVRCGGRPARMSWAELAALADAAPARFTPDVLLRPLLQDACLPTVAYVGGPSELRYQAQLGPLYRDLEIPRPLPLSRPSLTLVDVDDAARLGGLERVAGLLGDPAAARRLAAERSPGAAALEETLAALGGDAALGALARDLASGSPALADAAALLRRLGGLRRRSDAALDDAAALDPAIAAHVRRLRPIIAAAFDAQGSAIAGSAPARGEIPTRRPLVLLRRRLRWLRTRIGRWARRRGAPALAALRRLRPRGRPQERVMATAQIAAWLGEGAAHTLLPVAAPASPHTLVAIPRNPGPGGAVVDPTATLMRIHAKASAGTGAATGRRGGGCSMRVGVVCLGGLGGSTKVAAEVAVGLARAGHRPRIFFGEGGEALDAWLPAELASTIEREALPLPSTPRPLRDGDVAAATERLRERIVAADLDCLHVHYAAGLLRTSLAAAEAAGIPVVATLHGTDVTPWRRGDAARASLAAELRRCASVTAVSSWLSGQAVETFGLDAAPRVIHNAVDPQVFRPREVAALRRRLLGDDELLLIHVSNLRPVKRPRDAVAILAGLRAAGLRARLLILGDGPMRGEIEAEAAARGVAGSLRVDGSVAPEVLAAHLCASDVALMPSESESFGLAALEAMACGTPVVGSRCGGLVEVFTAVDRGHGRLGELLAPIGDVDGMVAVIRRLHERASAARWEHLALRRDLVSGALEAFPRSTQLAAYTELLAAVVASSGRCPNRPDCGVRVAG
ncbi:MAG: bacillithiol biosynthesis BshC [Nannocystaceae bacterium]